MPPAQSPEEGGSLKGRIKFYSPQRHFGYITVEGLLAEGGDEDDGDTSASQDDLYFNRRNLLDSTEIGKLDSGIPVTFDIAEDNGQYSAVNVKVRPEGDTGESPGAKSLTTTTGGDSSAEAAKGEEPDEDEDDDEDDIEIDVWQNIQAHYGQRPNPQKGVALCEDRYLEKKRLPVASLLPEGADETYACGIIGGVLDGHGGQCCVEYVSQHLFRNIAAQLQNTPRQRKKGGMNEVQKLEKFM
ncbi:hypothetical protein FOZ62_009245, partial [Perkinsus olseni]